MEQSNTSTSVGWGVGFGICQYCMIETCMCTCVSAGLCAQTHAHGWTCFRSAKPAYLAPETWVQVKRPLYTHCTRIKHLCTHPPTLSQATRAVDLFPGDTVESVKLRIENTYCIPVGIFSLTPASSLSLSLSFSTPLTYIQLTLAVRRNYLHLIFAACFLSRRTLGAR